MARAEPEPARGLANVGGLGPGQPPGPASPLPEQPVTRHPLLSPTRRQYDKDGAVSARAALKGPLPGGSGPKRASGR